MSEGKKIAKNTIYLYIRMIIVMLVSLYTIRAIIDILGVQDYGVYSAVGGIVLMMSFLLSTITNAAQRYFSYELGKKNYSQLPKVFSTVFLLYLILAVIVAIVIELAGIWFLENKMILPVDRMGAAHWVLHLSLLSFIISILYSPFNAIIIAHENMKIYTHVSIIEAIIKLGVVYLLMISPIDKLVFYALLLLLSHGVVAMIYGVYCYKSYQESHLMISIDRQILRELLGYTSWSMFGALAGGANNQGVNLLLNSFCGPLVNTSYSVSYQVSNIFQMFGVNLFNAIRPPMIKKYATKEFITVIDMVYRSTKYISFLLLLLILPLFFEINFVLTIWLGNVIDYMVDFSRLMMLYVFILQLSNPLTIIAQAGNQVKMYHGVVDSFVLLTLLLSYMFLRLSFPVQSVICTMIVILFIAHFIRLKVVESFLRISYADYFKKSILPFLLTLVPTSLVLLFFHYQLEEGWIRLCVIVLISSGMIIPLGYFVGLNLKEKAIANNLLRKYFQH